MTLADGDEVQIGLADDLSGAAGNRIDPDGERIAAVARTKKP
jgi:hypothetical protein